MWNLTMLHYKHDLSNKYTNSFKAAALSTKHRRCFTNSYQIFLTPNLIMSMWYWKLNITLIIWDLACITWPSNHVTSFYINCVNTMWSYYFYTLKIKIVKLKTDTPGFFIEWKAFIFLLAALTVLRTYRERTIA